MPNVAICDACGAKIVEYRQRLNQLHVEGLRALYAAGGKGVHIGKDLQLEFSEQSNFQKMRYFGLVEKAYTEDGLRQKGRWDITQKGRLFVEGIGYCYPVVWTYRGDPVRFEGEPIEINDVTGEVDESEDYAATALPHFGED